MSRYIKEEKVTKGFMLGSRIIWTLILAMFYGLGIALVLCLMNIGLWIEGHTDDQIIGILMIMAALYLGWISSRSTVKNLMESEEPFTKFYWPE